MAVQLAVKAFRSTLLVGALIAFVLFGARAEARRIGPKAVAPLVVAGVRYEVPHFGAFRGRSQNGGYVDAVDAKTGKLIWSRMIYRVRYDVNRERDVQDVFITKIKVTGKVLWVKTEASEEFEMDLPSGRVRALTPLGPHVEVAVQPGVAPSQATPGSPEPQIAAVPLDDRACRVGRAKNESAECFAVRCAEDFVRRNGYTLDAAIGPIAGESVDSPSLAMRRGTLEGSAVGYIRDPPGHLVAFRYSSSAGKTGRAVTMSGTFSNLRVQHQDLLLSAGLSVPTCPSRDPG